MSAPDLFQAARAAAPVDQRPLTVAHQLIAGCLGVVVAIVIEDPRRDMAIEMLAEALTRAHADGPQAEALVEAARHVVQAAPSRRSVVGAEYWMRALLAAHAAVADYLFGRACAAHERLFPPTAPATEKDAADA